MKRSAWIGLGLLTVSLPVFWYEARFASGEIAALKHRLRVIREMPASEREARRLSWNGQVPELSRTEALVRPVVQGGGVLETTFSFVAPGMTEDQRPLALRGSTVLAAHLSPWAWVTGAPLELFGELLAAEGPPGEILEELAKSQFIVWAGVEKEELERLRDLARKRYGRDVLVPGWSDGRKLHVTLRFDVVEALAAGESGFERFRALGPK